MNFPIDVAASLSLSFSLSLPLSPSLSLPCPLEAYQRFMPLPEATQRYLLLCASSSTAFLLLPDAVSHGNGFLLQRLQMHRSGHSAVRP